MIDEAVSFAVMLYLWTLAAERDVTWPAHVRVEIRRGHIS
jgi:hypothetical protein